MLSFDVLTTSTPCRPNHPLSPWGGCAAVQLLVAPGGADCVAEQGILGNALRCRELPVEPLIDLTLPS